MSKSKHTSSSNSLIGLFSFCGGGILPRGSVADRIHGSEPPRTCTARLDTRPEVQVNRTRTCFVLSFGLSEKFRNMALQMARERIGQLTTVLARPPAILSLHLSRRTAVNSSGSSGIDLVASPFATFWPMLSQLPDCRSSSTQDHDR